MTKQTLHDKRGEQGANRRTGLSFGAGFFFAFRLFVMLLSVRIFGTDPQTGTGITVALNFFFLVLVLLQGPGAASPDFDRLWKTGTARWVKGFLLFSGLSLLWSVAASLTAAAVYWCVLVSDVAIVVLLLRSEFPLERIHAFFKGYVWGACAIALIAWLLPAQSDMRLGDEELLGANQIGYLCAFAFFLAQYLVQKKLGRYVPATVILGVTLLRSLSKTTIAAFMIAEGFLLWKDTSISRRSKTIVLGCVALTALIFSSLLTSYFDVYSNAGNSPETLTGRLGIWLYVLDEAVKQPLIGHGFYSVWKVIPPFGTFEPRHAHNEILQQFYLYGAAGLCLFWGLYGSFVLQVKRFGEGFTRTFFFALMTFVLIRGVADTEVYDFSLPLWALVLFSALLWCNQEPRRSMDLHGS
jgi:exopolysaccharide production protein ExoQ